jgi:hypothetical protein
MSSVFDIFARISLWSLTLISLLDSSDRTCVITSSFDIIESSCLSSVNILEPLFDDARIKPSPDLREESAPDRAITPKDLLRAPVRATLKERPVLIGTSRSKHCRYSCSSFLALL